MKPTRCYYFTTIAALFRFIILKACCKTNEWFVGDFMNENSVLLLSTCKNRTKISLGIYEQKASYTAEYHENSIDLLVDYTKRI